MENKQYVIYLLGEDGKKYSSRVLSEGTLRILALCILEQDEKYTGLICFEEPENGIHPFRIKAVVELLKDLTTDFTDPEMPLRQVIVNTHSPILVNEINKWEDDVNVSLHFAEMRNRVIENNGNRINIKASVILPVSKEGQSSLEVSSQDRKLSLQAVAEYLSSIKGE